MSKKLQLKFLVGVAILIVILVYLYINKNFSLGFDKEFENLKDSVGVEVDQLSQSSAIQNLQDGWESLKDKLKEDQPSLESKIADNVLEKLSSPVNIIYKHEPWRIQFNYDYLMSKDFNQDQEEIVLFYEEVPNLKVSLGRHVLEGNFNDWLNNNYNLQDLDKQEYNGLIFWRQDLSNTEKRKEEYYFNLNKYIFIIVLELNRDQEGEYWQSLENIIKSFNIIESINL